MIILFDLDGTLIDSTEAILEGFEVAFKSFGKDVPTDKEITSLIGLPLEAMFVQLGVKSSVDEYVSAYKLHYRKISKDKTYLLKNAKEALEQADKIATLAVVTTKTSRYSIEILEHLNIMKYFKVLIGREDVTHPKPHKEPIELALKRLNLPPQQTIMIGDTCFDIDSANNAGVESIAVLSGYGTKEQLSICGSTIVSDVLEAIRKINSIRKTRTNLIEKSIEVYFDN